MKFIVLAGLLFATYFQVNARSIGQSNQMPTVLRETMEQSFSCAMQMGSRALSIPKLKGIDQMPEDNQALNELWGCIWKKKQIIDDAAHVNADKLENYLVDLVSMFGEPDAEVLQQAHQMVVECKDQPGDKYGLKSVQIQNCINGYIAQKMLRK